MEKKNRQKAIFRTSIRAESWSKIDALSRNSVGNRREDSFATLHTMYITIKVTN